MLNKTNKWDGSPGSVEYRPGLRPFLGLLLLTAVVIIGGGFVFWYIPTVGLSSIHPVLPYITGAVLLAAALFVVAGAVFITAAAVNSRRGGDGLVRSGFGKVVLGSAWVRWLLVKVFLPFMVMVGGIFRVPRIKIEQVFIEINNQMVRLMGRALPPERLLILMPHCIQFDDCRIKVTRDVRNCVGCGKCEIGGLVELMDEFGIALYVLTGGTIARRKVVEHRPDAVLAVACERDLTSGIQDAYPLPVYAIVNKRPNGYCFQTGVDIGEVRRAIVGLLGRPQPGLSI